MLIDGEFYRLKLLVYIFIGSWFVLLVELGDKMIGFDKFVNYVFMVVGVVVGMGVVWVVYKKMM